MKRGSRLADHSLDFELGCQKMSGCKEKAEENHNLCHSQPCTRLRSNEALADQIINLFAVFAYVPKKCDGPWGSHENSFL